MKTVKLNELPPYSVGNTIQLVGAIYHGEGRLLLCPVPGDETTLNGDEPVQLLVMDPEEWNEFLRRSDLQEVEVSNGVSKAVLRKTQRVIDQSVSWGVFRRDGFSCRYCGREDVPLTVDHLITWEEGGPSIPANLLSACRKCNKTRGNKPYEEWLAHPYYIQVSVGLSDEVRGANLVLGVTLDEIPRQDRVRSR